MDAIRPAWTSGSIEGGRFAELLDDWVVHPIYSTRLGNIGFVVLIAAVIVLTQLRGPVRTVLLVPTLYLAAFVWENRLVAEPSVTRILLLGALLIALMTARPQGLLGNAAGGDRLSLAERACSSCQRSRKAFGGLQVIDELDLHVDEGEIVSVIGPNGAGKTTLFNLITGIYRPDSGEILLDGRSLVGLLPHKITGRGVARTFQTLRLFLNMTVKENVMAATYGHTKARVWQSILRTPRARREEREIHALAEEVLGFFGERLMGYRWDQPAYSALVREPAPARDRPRHGDAPAHPAARRAGRRDEPDRDARDHRADRAAAPRGRLHDPRDRARHARRRGHLRPRRRARPRRQDRRGHVRPRRHRSRASSRPTSAPAAATK